HQMTALHDPGNRGELGGGEEGGDGGDQQIEGVDQQDVGPDEDEQDGAHCAQDVGAEHDQLRVGAKLIMFGSNVLRAVGTILFIFVGTNVLLIYALNLLIATVTAFFAPAELTSIPRIVQRGHLM